MEIVDSLVLADECVLEITDQPLFELVELVQLLLVHRLFHVVFSLDGLVGAQNGVHQLVLVVFRRKLGVLTLLVHGGSVLLLVVEIGVAEGRDRIVILLRVHFDLVTTAEVVFLDSIHLLLNRFLVLVLSRIVDEVLMLPVCFDVEQPVVVVLVITAASTGDMFSERRSLVGDRDLSIKPVLFVDQFLQPVFHGKFLFLALFQHELFLELSRRIQTSGPVFDCLGSH